MPSCTQSVSCPSISRREGWSCPCPSSSAVWLAPSVIFLLTLLTCPPAGAETVVEAWVQRYNGPGNGTDGTRSVAVDSDGNVVVTGESFRNGSGNDFATIKYSTAGTPLWTNRYTSPGNNNDFPQSITVDANGNVFVTGSTTPQFSSFYDYATIKYSSDGAELWVRSYNGSGNQNDRPSSVAVDGNGNVLVTGWATTTGGDFDFVTIQYSNAGAPLWTNRYDDDGSFDVPIAVGTDDGGNVFVTGYSDPFLFVNDCVTIKYSSAGTPLWTNRYDGPANARDLAVALAVDTNGDVVVTGLSVGSANTNDFVTIQYSGAGVPLWTNRYNGPGDNDDAANAVGVDTDGNVFVTGYSIGSGSGYDFATIAYSSTGVPLWTNRYNGLADANDYAQDVGVDDDGNIFVTGYSYGAASANDYVTIKYSGAGVPLWTNRYNGPANGDDLPQTRQSLAVSPEGGVIVTGASDGDSSSATSYDFATVKYLTVIPADVVFGPILEQGDFVVGYAGTPGLTYTIECTENLAPANWLSVTNLSAPATDMGLGIGVFEFRQDPTGGPQGFYRTMYPSY